MKKVEVEQEVEVEGFEEETEESEEHETKKKEFMTEGLRLARAERGKAEKILTDIESSLWAIKQRQNETNIKIQHARDKTAGLEVRGVC